MKIGFYGGVANNMYLCARAYAHCGQDVLFIRDWNDRFVFSQPVWEDARLTFSYSEVYQSYHWTPEDWDRIETQCVWKKPPWYRDPRDIIVKAAPPGNRNRLKLFFRRRKRKLFDLLKQEGNYYWGSGVDYWDWTLELMRTCDVVVACNIIGEILAFISDEPYVIMPCGQDIYTLGGHSTEDKSHLQLYKIRHSLLKKAFSKALWIGFNAPPQKDHPNTSVLRKYKVKLSYFPYPAREALSKSQKRNLLANAMNELKLEVPSAKYIFFMPSRVDFKWKGTDRFLRALQKFGGGKNKIHLIVSGWGQDYEDAKKMIDNQAVTILPFVVSKPILYDLYMAADLMVDQFVYGYYGTSTTEAMSCGTPVMLWIDEKAFADKGMKPPPVLNAQTEEDIGKIITRILAGEIDLEATGKAGQEWMQRVCGEQVVVSQEIQRFRSALA